MREPSSPGPRERGLGEPDSHARASDGPPSAYPALSSPLRSADAHFRRFKRRSITPNPLEDVNLLKSNG